MYLPTLLAVTLPSCVSAAFPRLQQRNHDKVLHPAVRWDNDFTDLNNLKPKTRERMYYAEYPGFQDEAVKHLFLDVDAGFKRPTVILEKSQYVSDISCAPGVIRVIFDDKKAYKLAESTWSEEPNLVLVTHKSGCGSQQDRRTFWTVSSLSFETLGNGGVANADVRKIEIRDLLSSMNLEWGRHKPARSSIRARDPGPSNHAPPWLPKVQKRWNKTIEGDTVYFDLEPPSEFLTDSPWGEAVELWSSEDGGASLAVYCVSCGVSGDLDFSGSAVVSPSWSGLDIDSIAVGMTGSMQGTMGLGLDAKLAYSQTWDRNIATYPFTFFQVPELIWVGPALALNAELTVGIEVEGTILYSIDMSVGPFDARVDFIDTDNCHASGFEPSITDDVQASDQITATASFGLPVSFNIGIGIEPLDWNKSIAIIDTPAMNGEATYEVTSGKRAAQRRDSMAHELNPRQDCSGIDWNVNFSNDVTIDLFGEEQIPISHWDSPSLLSGCIPV